ncbi:MAG: hypothetical protein K2P85_01880 [Flavobacteriaceae bacterium]|nr:hypothetical protein [Flavobacteriaceae bacterium]
MNKKGLAIGTAVVAGATSRGLTGLITTSTPVKIGINVILAGLGGYVAFTTSGNTNKSAMMGGAGLGVAVAQGLEAVKGVFSLESVASKINPTSKWGQFLQKAGGLSGASGGLNGYFDALGNYHEDGLGGYIDPAGNYVQDGLNGYDDDGLGVYEDDGLNGYDDDGLGVYEDDGLGGYDDDGLGVYEDDGLGGYDDDGLGVYEDDGLGISEEENFSY